MTTKQRNVIMIATICFMVLCFTSSMEAKDLREEDVLNLRNATDSLILLTELATESSGDYVQAKADHIEMLSEYVKHMENRHGFRTVVSKNDIRKELKLAIKRLKKDDSKLKVASEAIARFLSKHKLFRNEPILKAKPEIISKKMRAVIKDLLNEANKKTRIHVSDPNMVNAEVAYRANRKAIVYLYFVRFQWSEIITSEERINLVGDINRTIYWNRVLMHSNITEEQHLRLTKHSVNELRHLRLLHAIMDNDMREVNALLQIVIKQAFPDAQFLVEK